MGDSIIKISDSKSLGFWTLSTISIQKTRNTAFWKLDVSVFKWGEVDILLDPSERANLKHSINQVNGNSSHFTQLLKYFNLQYLDTDTVSLYTYQQPRPYKSSEINSIRTTHWRNSLSCRSKPSWNCWRFVWEPCTFRWMNSSNKKYGMVILLSAVYIAIVNMTWHGLRLALSLPDDRNIISLWTVV
jgi:hypothetical protein